MGVAAFSALGLAVTTIIHKAEAAPAVANTIILPLAFVSDIFVPLGTDAPRWLDVIGDIFPLKPFSQSMQSLFAVTLVRPGRYRLTNTISGAEAAVVVTYPKVGKTPYRPPEPLEIDCGAKGFGASKFTISPAQGIIFRLSTESRIQLELVEPDDGPKQRGSQPKASFRSPPATGSQSDA